MVSRFRGLLRAVAGAGLPQEAPGLEWACGTPLPDPSCRDQAPRRRTDTVSVVFVGNGVFPTSCRRAV